MSYTFATSKLHVTDKFVNKNLVTPTPGVLLVPFYEVISKTQKMKNSYFYQAQSVSMIQATIGNSLEGSRSWSAYIMMTSSKGNIFRVTGALCAGNSPVPLNFPHKRPVTRRFDVFFELLLNKRLSKQSWGRWFETPPWSLWRQCNDICLVEIHFTKLLQ